MGASMPNTRIHDKSPFSQARGFSSDAGQPFLGRFHVPRQRIASPSLQLRSGHVPSVWDLQVVRLSGRAFRETKERGGAQTPRFFFEGIHYLWL